MTMLDDLAAAAREAKQYEAAAAAAADPQEAARAAEDAEFLWAIEFSDAGHLLPNWVGHATVGGGEPFATAEIAPETWLTCVSRRVPGTIRLSGTITIVRRCPGCGHYREDPVSKLSDFATAADPVCDGKPHTFRRLPQHDAETVAAAVGTQAGGSR